MKYQTNRILLIKSKLEKAVRKRIKIDVKNEIFL